MWRKVIFSIFVIVILLGGGTGIAFLLEAAKPQPPTREFIAPAPVVQWTELSLEDVTEEFTGFGTAEPDREARLAAQISGVVVELVDEIESGTHVEKGQDLVRVDVREYELTLDRAKSLALAEQAVLEELESEVGQLSALTSIAKQETRVARDELRRLADLFEQGQATKKEYDFANLAFQQAKRVLQEYELEFVRNGPRQRRARASLAGYQAAAKLEKLNVDRCIISAPFAGTVNELNVEIGDRLSVGQVLLTLVDRSRVQLPLQLPISVYARVTVGSQCKLTTDASLDLAWRGRITRISPVAQEQSRTFAAYVEVDNDKYLAPMLPGSFIRATIFGPTYPQCLLVPRGGIRNNAVWVYVDGQARKRHVQIVRLIGEQAIVNGELADGDRIILSQLSRLVDGMPVRLLENATKAASTSTDVVALEGPGR